MAFLDYTYQVLMLPARVSALSSQQEPASPALSSMAQRNNIASQLGSGIIEISAIATLVGAPIAEAMTLGLKSAAGLPWASITIFGMLHVTKVALAAAIPDWLREPLGLDNKNVEAALGTLHEAFNNRRVHKKAELGDVKGIIVSSRDETIPASNWQPHDEAQRKNPARAKCIYRTDRSLDLVLGTITDSESGRPVPIHEFMQDYGRHPREVKELIMLGLSFCKVAEVVTLRMIGSNRLWFFTGIPWAYGFLAAVLLMIQRLSHDKMTSSNIDVMVGRLPSPLYAGGPGRIVCGLPQNVRRSMTWRIVWMGFLPASVIGLIGTYLLLGKNEPRVVYTWIAFQTLWLLLRTLMSYVSDNAAGTHQSLPVARTWETSPIHLRRRTMQLILSHAGYQASQHPRSAKYYQQDVASIPAFISLFETANWTLTSHLTLSKLDLTGHLYLQDVGGDNVFRSLNWINGAALSNNDLYDSALAFVKLRNRTVAIPSVRAMTCGCAHGPDRNLPRGDSHVCNNMVWIFWMPAVLLQTGSESSKDTKGPLDLDNSLASPVRIQGWLHAHSHDTRGMMACEYMTTAELDDHLRQVRWQISLKHSSELEKIVDESRKASRLLHNMIEDLVSEPMDVIKAEAAVGAGRVLDDRKTAVRVTEIV